MTPRCETFTERLASASRIVARALSRASISKPEKRVFCWRANQWLEAPFTVCDGCEKQIKNCGGPNGFLGFWFVDFEDRPSRALSGLTATSTRMMLCMSCFNRARWLRKQIEGADHVRYLISKLKAEIANAKKCN